MFGKASLALTVSLFLAVSVCGEVFQIPKDWTGKDKTSDNNPVKVADKPMWRFDRLWPDDPYDAEAYQPMVWSNGQWVGKDHNFGGQPAASYSRSTLTFAARSGWGGGGDGDGYKLPALAFIPPKAGKYKVQGTVAAEFWSGGGTVKLVLLTRDVKKKDVTEVKALSFSNDPEGNKPQDLADIEVTLAEGQELIITAVMANQNTGVTYTVTKFRIVSAE